MSSDRQRNEDALFTVVVGALKRWLDKVRTKVMAPFDQYRMQPDPSAVYATQADWDSEVDTILTHIGQIAMDAWSEASEVPPVSRHAFVMAQLAMTQNFLTRIPDEVYHLVFAELADGINAGNDIDKLAARVDNVLSWTGSENWTGRARLIAMTETTRAYGAGTLAAGMEQSRVTGRLLQKRWDTEKDRKVRATHEAVDGQVQQLGMPFYVGGYPLMFPGDPMGPADEVCNCRCDLVITNERGR